MAPIYKAFVKNNGLHPVAGPGIPSFYHSVYEVIKLIDGKPLFFDEHLHRWQNSASLAGLPMVVNKKQLAISLLQLTNINGVYNGNIKLIYGWKSRKDKGEYYIFFIPHQYPTDIDYQMGVRVGLLSGSRPNPAAKVDHVHLRKSANELIKQNSLYEVLLTDPEGYITEGSRSNCFLIRDGAVVTPPSDAVLPGVTRQKVMEILEREQIPVREELLHKDDLKKVEGVFLTGTSPGVLPVSQIENLSFTAEHNLIHQVRTAYSEQIEEYVGGLQKV